MKNNYIGGSGSGKKNIPFFKGSELFLSLDCNDIATLGESGYSIPILEIFNVKEEDIKITTIDGTNKEYTSFQDNPERDTDVAVAVDPSGGGSEFIEKFQMRYSSLIVEEFDRLYGFWINGRDSIVNNIIEKSVLEFISHNKYSGLDYILENCSVGLVKTLGFNAADLFSKLRKENGFEKFSISIESKLGIFVNKYIAKKKNDNLGEMDEYSGSDFYDEELLFELDEVISSLGGITGNILEVYDQIHNYITTNLNLIASFDKDDILELIDYLDVEYPKSQKSTILLNDLLKIK